MERPKTFEDARRLLALTVRGIADMLVEASGKTDKPGSKMSQDDALRRAVERVSGELPAILYEEQKRLDWLGETEGQASRWTEELFKVARGEELGGGR